MMLDNIEASSRRAEFRFWDFVPEARPVADLRQEAMRLAARQVAKGDEPSQLVPLDAETIRSVLPPPAATAIHSPVELADYHWREYSQAIGGGLWRAAAWQADHRLADLPAPGVEDFLRSARVHFRNENWSKVLTQCQAAEAGGMDEVQNAEAIRLKATALAEQATQQAAPAVWEEPLAALRRAAERNWNDTFTLIKLAEHFVQARQWVEAENALKRACEIERFDPHGRRPSPWQRLATLYLVSDPPQLEKYRATCDDMFARFGNIPGYEAIVAWPCLLHPCGTTGTPADSAAVQKLVELARKAVRDYPTNYYRLNTLGAALVRSGNYAEAVAQLDASRQFFNATARENIKPDYQGRPVDWLFLALAERGRNNLKRAGHWRSLADAVESAELPSGDDVSRNPRHTWEPWKRRCCCAK
jgi:hypothetical protein